MPHKITERRTDIVDRPGFIQTYASNIGTHLNITNKSLQEGDGKDCIVDKELITAFLKHVTTTRFKDPVAKFVVHERPGCAAITDVPLSQFMDKHQGNIIVPSGTIYKPATEHVSFLTNQITTLKARRKASKGKMLEYRAMGDKARDDYYNSDQSQQKISMNSIPGAMGSKTSFLSDLAGFNGITSSGRYFITSSYANCERLLEGNFYFRDKERIYNHLVLCARTCPPREVMDKVVAELGIQYASADDVYDFILENFRKYDANTSLLGVYQWLINCSGTLLTYIFYFNNARNIMRFNSDRWLKVIRDLYDPALALQSEPQSHEKLFTLDKDLVIVLSTVYNHMFPLDGKKKASIYDLHKFDMDLAVKMATIGVYMETKIKHMFKYLDVFLKHQTVVPNALEHKTMQRNCVLGSDTDSILFTTKNWIKWYTGELKIDVDAVIINTFVVYILSKSNAYLMKTISVHRGCTGEAIFTMEMKNEFFFPVFSMSSLMKHYTALYTIQEGVVLPKPRSEIKGVQFKGSKLCSTTINFTTDFIDNAHLKIIEAGKLSLNDLIQDIIAFELRIYSSLLSGETTFLPIQPVKLPGQYKNADQSLHFNYKYWEAVYAHKYGSIEIPTKCYVVPVGDMVHASYVEKLASLDAEVCKRHIDYLSSISKGITRVPINTNLDLVPEELRACIRVKDIITDNLSPLYLYMESFGISTGAGMKHKILFAEMYGGINFESTVSEPVRLVA